MKEIKKLDRNIKTISFSDLYSMYNYVHSMNINNLNPAMKSMIKNKSIELENEILVRIFDINPYSSDGDKQVAEVKGKDPIQVLKSINDKTLISPDTIENK